MFAKTLYKPTRPPEIDKIMKKYTSVKLPYFFIYAKNKKKEQVAPMNASTMNRISNIIPNSRIIPCKTVGEFDYHMLLSNMDFDISSNYHKILESYDYWNKRQKYIASTEANEHKHQEDLYVFHYIREKILEENLYDKNIIVDSLVTFLYKYRKNASKKLLWGAFGEEIVYNLQKNTLKLGKVCTKCGKRFYATSPNQQYCSIECREK